MAAVTDALLRVRELRTYFYTSSGVARAVDGVSFDVPRGAPSPSWARAAAARA